MFVLLCSSFIHAMEDLETQSDTSSYESAEEQEIDPIDQLENYLQQQIHNDSESKTSQTSEDLCLPNLNKNQKIKKLYDCDDEIEYLKTLSSRELAKKTIDAIKQNKTQTKLALFKLIHESVCQNASERRDIYAEIIKGLFNEILIENYVNTLVDAIQSKDVKKIGKAYNLIFLEPLYYSIGTDQEKKLSADQQAQIAREALIRINFDIKKS